MVSGGYFFRYYHLIVLRNLRKNISVNVFYLFSLLKNSEEWVFYLIFLAIKKYFMVRVSKFVHILFLDNVLFMYNVILLTLSIGWLASA